jgi:5,10-methylenetetrahydromethanopterin reductase
VRVPPRLTDVAPDLLHAESWPATVHAGESFVDDDAVEVFARRFCLYGTADEIAARLTELSRSGVVAVRLRHVGSYDLPRRLVADFADQALPVLKSCLSGRHHAS